MEVSLGFQDNIPQEDDTLAKSQEDLLNNFQAISVGFNANHEGFNSENKGMHKFLNMPEQEEAPSTGDSYAALYTKKVDGKPELFFREKSNGSELKITNAFTPAATGNIIIPGGIRFSWGVISFTGTSSPAIYPSGITNIFSVQFSVNGNVHDNFAWSGIGANGFKIIRLIGTPIANINWLVIGK